MGHNYKSLVYGNERILLHLLELPFGKRNLERAIDAPDILTTRAIADAVKIERHHMSSHFKILMANEYIEGIITRVKHKKRKQTVYFLTVKGRTKAKALKETLIKQEITVLGPGQTRTNLKFPKVADYLKRKKMIRNITDLELCKLTNYKGILDLNLISQTRPNYTDFIQGASKPRYFFGRGKELRQLKTWIGDKRLFRIINIFGVAGIGKTTLASKLIEKYTGHTNIFWHNVREWDNIRSILSNFGDFLSEMGDDHLKTYLEVNRTLDLDNSLKFIHEKLKNLEALLIFDDLHKANEGLRDFFKSLLEIAEQTRGVKIIILTRNLITLYDQQKVVAKKSIAELELTGLDYESSTGILRRKGLPRDKYKDIYKITSGNPLLLEINESYKTSKRYIYEEIFSQLTKEEQRIVEILSTYKVPIRYDAFFIDENISPDTIENLVKKLIIKETSHGLYDTHEFIREFFYKRLAPQTKRQYHTICAEYYLSQRAPKNHLEILFHYIKSEKYQSAIELAIGNAQDILSQNLSDRFFTVLEELPEEQVPLPQWVDILMLKAQICFKIGDWGKSVQFNYHAIEVSSGLGNNYIKAKAYCELGYIHEAQNEFEDALAAFQKSLEISKKLKAKKRIAEAKRGIGRYYWRKNDYKTAERYYKASLNSCNKIEDFKLLGAVYIDIGNIYHSRYQGAQAIKYLEKALNYLLKEEDKLQLARAYNSLGSVYSDTNKFKEGIDYYKKELRLLKPNGDLRLSGYALSNLGYCYAKLHRMSEAEDYAVKANEIYEKTNNENILFQILRTKALVNQYFGNWGKAIDCFEKSIEIVEKNNVQFLLANTLSELGELYKSKGDPTNARKYNKKARQLKNKLMRLK